MLSRRLQTILNVRERAALLRLYFAGHHAQPNPLPRQDTSLNQRISLKKINLPFCTTQRLFDESARSPQTISRACHTSTDDNTENLRTENGYARSVLVASKDCKSIGVPLEKIDHVTDEEAESILREDLTNASADEILEVFRKLSCHAKIASQSLDDDKHRNILSALTINLSNFSDKQLHTIFQCLNLWKDIVQDKTLAYEDFTKALDNQLRNRATNWTPDEALMMCDYLHQLQLARKTKFPTNIVNKLGKKPSRMSTSNFLHFMFLLNICRVAAINMYEVEYSFGKIVEQFTANELGIVAMGFFKTKTPLRDHKILTRIQTKVLEEMNTMDDISLSAIMKLTRLSAGLKNLKSLCDILEAVKPRVSKLAIPCLVHIAHAAAFVQCYNVELMELTVQRFTMDIDKARLKDIERFSLALSIFNYDRKAPVYEKIVETLRDPKRAAEIERFATILPSIMLYLSNANIFPMDLMKSVLDPEFLKRVYDNNAFKIGYSTFALESNLRTEFPEYDGPFLPDNIRNFIAKKFLKDLMAKTANKNPIDRLILETAHMCKLVFNSEKAIHMDYILPQFMKPDIIICLDEKDNVVEPEPILSKLPFGTIKRPPPETSHFKWIAIVLGTQNQMIKESNQFTGPFMTKLKQLKKLGYIPIAISHTDWRDLPNLEAKENYLRNILPVALNAKVSAEAI